MTHSDNIYIKLILAGLLASLFPISIANAMVSGVCSNCHTMHDSYEGASMRLGLAGVAGAGSSECFDCHSQLRNILLRMDCIGCHAQGMISSNNIDDNMPQVAHIGSSTDLAGGNFFHIYTGDDLNGHNVHGFDKDFLGLDGNHQGNTPPGWDAAFDPSSGKFVPGSVTGQIMCAGENGCHGDRDIVSQNIAIKGAHHTNDSVLQYGASFNEALQGTTVGTSYRYLLGVKGAEASDWEANPTTINHNEYKGSTFDAPRPTEESQEWSKIKSMSSFCAECHGIFHSGPDLMQTDVWVRHPSDVVIPDTAPFNNDPNQKYSLLAPVARQTIGGTSASDAYTPGTDVVFCLSCHRSHASPWPSMLRWDYDICFNESPQSADCGCFTCHSTY